MILRHALRLPALGVFVGFTALSTAEQRNRSTGPPVQPALSEEAATAVWCSLMGPVLSLFMRTGVGNRTFVQTGVVLTLSSFVVIR
jgi:uncharacterized membrane protein YqaE (UPF0057 family)